MSNSPNIDAIMAKLNSIDESFDEMRRNNPSTGFIWLWMFVIPAAAFFGSLWVG